MDTQLLPILLLCIAVVFLLFFIITAFTIIWRQLSEVKSLMYGRYVRFDPKIDEMVDLAVDYWRLTGQIERIKPLISPEDTKRLDNSLRRLDNYLKKNDIEISDYAGRTANDGMNVDVISIEHDSSLKKSIIKETIIPAVSYKGSLRKRSQVIVLDNSQIKEQKNEDK